MLATLSCLAGMVLFLLLWAGLALLVYRDAARRGYPMPFLWAVLVFLFSFIGLAMYILNRKRMGRTPPRDGGFADHLKDEDEFDELDDWPPKEPKEPPL